MDNVARRIACATTTIRRSFSVKLIKPTLLEPAIKSVLTVVGVVAGAVFMLFLFHWLHGTLMLAYNPNW